MKKAACSYAVSDTKHIPLLITNAIMYTPISRFQCFRKADYTLSICNLSDMEEMVWFGQ